MLQVVYMRNGQKQVHHTCFNFNEASHMLRDLLTDGWTAWIEKDGR